MKEELIKKLKEECTNKINNEYINENKVIVFGEGNIDAKIMLIGEAPGEKETILLRPFVGKAGKNLDEFLEIVELLREDIYITNTVLFRPFNINEKTGRLSNRPPNKKEIQLCFPYLIKQIEIVKPDIIVTLGNTPLKALLNNKALIGNVHGRLIKMDTYRLFPLYHPASIIYNRKLKEIYYEDLLKLKEII